MNQTLPIVQIKREDGRVIVINESDFDPETMKLYVEGEEESDSSEENSEADSEVSSEENTERDALESMTVAELRSFAATEEIEVSSSMLKAQIIDALLESSEE